MSVVIVVDDDPQIRDVVSRYLNRLGHQVVVANNGAEALELVGKWSIAELIVSDMNMPVMNGRQLFNSVRAVRPVIPFIFMTGGEDELPSDNRTMHLTKPLDPELFRGAVADALQMAAISS